jgi:hypothetical protein
MGRDPSGVDSKGRRHLVVPAPADATEEREDSSRGISIEIRPYLSGGTRRLYCDVSCRLEELNEMFTVIAEDMLAELRDRDFDSPFPACLRVLERWRRLLERVPTRLMSRNAQAGLVAELLFLRRLTGRSPKWIDLWVGPEGGRHDFVSKETDVEVKASLSEEQRKVHVQSLHQLAIAEGAALYLYFVRLREPTGQGISIPDLVEELLVRGINSGELHDRLLQVGYSPLDRDAYQTTRFEVLEESAFRVDADAFPRLTPDSLRGSLPQGCRIPWLRYRPRPSRSAATRRHRTSESDRGDDSLMRLDYHAEQVTDYGGITGDGLGNLLGAPKLEPLELLVRELCRTVGTLVNTTTEMSSSASSI